MPAIFGASGAHKPQVVPSSTVADINNLASNIIILSVFIIRTSVKLFPAPNSKALSLGLSTTHTRPASFLLFDQPATKLHSWDQKSRSRAVENKKKTPSFVLDTR